MTALLVSVTSPAEAELALGAGATVIDAKDPTRGALGDLPVSVVRAIVKAVAGRAEVSAAVGGDATLGTAQAMAETGATYVKTPVPGGDAGAAFLEFLGRSLGHATKLVAVFAADREQDLDLVATAAAAGFSGAMLDTLDKGASLTDVMDMADIAHFVAAARRAKLTVGLAGSLKVLDVGSLVPLRPDLIGFRGALCEDGIRTRPLDPTRIRAAVAALAVHAARRAAGD
jgi:uncharacterized protein (UPF0264 family)